jgi:hypothetical protein
LLVISLGASDRRQELDSDTSPAVFEEIDTNNLGKVVTIIAVTRRVIR